MNEYLVKIIQKSVFAISIASCVFSITTADAADENRTASTLAKWQFESQQKSLEINVADLLTPSQKDIVNSGFSTFTIFAVSDKKMAEGDNLPDQRLICSVKYDTWEERYQLIRVDPPPVLNLVAKDFKSWAERCLQYKLIAPDLIEKFQNGGTLNAILQIRQSSPDEGAKIKNWLVRQQSGFMQGLYAHMLGEFQFKGTVRIQITVPSMTSTSIETPNKSPLPQKGI